MRADDGSPNFQLSVSELGIRRLPIYLLIDCSPSMGHKLSAVASGIESFRGLYLASPGLVDTAYICLITFGGEAVRHDLVPIDEFEPPRLQTSPGGTALGAAIHLLCQSIREDLFEIGPDRKGDYRPIVFLLTDGTSSDNTDYAISELQMLRQRPTIYAFGCGRDVDQDKLLAITPNVYLLPAFTDDQVVAAFQWFASSFSDLYMSSRTSRTLQMPSVTTIPGVVIAERTKPASASTLGSHEVYGIGQVDDKRAKELATLEAANRSNGQAPFYDVRLRTAAELAWVLIEHKWSGELYSVDSPADLRGIILNGLDLRGVKLARANLTGARLEGATLVNADFVDAKLNGADLTAADCTQADLSSADLSGARFVKTVLHGAKMEGANLTSARLIGCDATGIDLRTAVAKGTLFRGVDLSSANLRESIMDDSTQMIDVVFDTGTYLGDIRLGTASLTRIAWQQVPRIGDEQLIKVARIRGNGTGKNSEASIASAYRIAARAYRGLSIALRSQGLQIVASNYRLREQVLERKAMFREGRLLGWIFSWLLFVIAGYGERPARSFAAYLLVLLGFAGAYLALGTGTLTGFGLGTQSTINSPLAAVVFSVTSFHGRGFFPGGIALDDPITVLAAIEAIMGLFIEITFIATFTQRFFSR